MFTVKKNKSDVSATWKQDFGVSDYTITSEGELKCSSIFQEELLFLQLCPGEILL